MSRVRDFATWRRVRDLLRVEEDGRVQNVVLGSDVVPVVEMVGFRHAVSFSGQIDRPSGPPTARVQVRVVGVGEVWRIHTVYAQRLLGDASFMVRVDVVVAGVSQSWWPYSQTTGSESRLIDLFVPAGARVDVEVVGGVAGSASSWVYCLLGEILKAG